MEGEEVHSYTQAVDLLREVKRSNDRINSTIGVESSPLILSCLRAQTNPIEQALAKVDRFIARTERQYVGPDVLRRTATLKQHFRIQRDRRNMLISSIKEEEIVKKERKECVEEVLGKGERKAEGREQERTTAASQSCQSDVLTNAENLGVRIDQVDEMAMTKEGDLKEVLISSPSSPSSKKQKIVSYLQSNRKKVFYFTLFTVLKIAIFMILLK